MNEVLTRAEMEARFDGEWLLIAGPELDENLEVLSGRVVSHSTDRDVVYGKGMEMRPRHPASLSIVAVPGDPVPIL
jgi:hypothetical protein